LFDPLLDHRDLLLIDNRGTGRSEPIDCPELQSYEGDYVTNVGLCGAQLGTASDLYGTAFAVDDMAKVLDALGIDAVDMYGDSYGSYMAQAFAVRHADRVRTLVLDGTYPVEDQDPWYRDLNAALRDAFRVVCERDAGCDALGGDPVERIARLAEALRAEPLTGTAYDADGIRRRVTVDAPVLGYLTGVATYGHAVYRELDAAAAAYLQDESDPAPLLRIAAEQILWGDGGPVEEYSEGLYMAAFCNDYPQLWDIESPIPERPPPYEAALAELRATDHDAFHPFTIDDWVAPPWTEFTSCIRWPVPSNHVPPIEPGTPYPDVPTLVIAGELDSLTSPAGAEIVAGRFPNSTYVEVANGVHVMALGDFSRCASDLTVRFVSTGGDAGDISCANRYQEVRVVEEFPGTLAEVDPAPQGDRIMSSAADRRGVAAAANTVADIFPRWLNAVGFDGVGLRGAASPRVGWKSSSSVSPDSFGCPRCE
jgi:pimeloyl-ACP methyl ester carboxylesterase